MTAAEDQAFNHALASLRSGKAADAERLFRQVLATNGRHVGALNLLGVLLIHLGKYQEAEPYLQRALKENPSSDATFYNYGICLKALGRPSEAVERFNQALAINPTVRDTWNNRGTVFNDLARFQEALTDFDRAISIDPGHPDAYCNRGNALIALGLYDQALAGFDGALARRPDFTEAWLGRANALWKLQRGDDALAAYDKALALRPDLADAWLGRGNVLGERKRHDDALAAYEKALSSRPDLPEAWLGRGNVFSARRRYDEALSSYDRALALKPDFAEAWLGVANVLFERKRYQDALAAYEKALGLSGDLAEALFGRGLALLRFNRNDESIAEFQRALAVKPDYAEARFSACFAELPALYKHEDEIAVRRRAYEQKLMAICEQVETDSMPGNLAKAIEAQQPFYLAYQGHNDRDLQRRYGALVCRVMERAYPPARVAMPPARGEPVRIGIVSGFFWRHSNWKIPIKGWVSQLDRKRFKLFGYHVGTDRDAETDVAAGMFDRFVHRPATVEEWRDEILADAPHVLIYPGLLMEGVSVQLAAQRLAPVQCNSWGHPETSGMPTLDYFLSSDLMEPSCAAEHYTEQLVRLPNLSIYYEPSEAESPARGRAELGLRADATVFWCGQSLYKYLPQFDHVFASIAKRADDCQFVFLRPSGLQVDALFQERLDRAFAAVGLKASHSCVLLPPLPPSEFVATVGQSDVFLDSIGWSGCNSTLESLAHNLPIVTFLGTLMRGRHSAAILRMMGVTETIADTVEDYISTAVRLANRPDERQRLSRMIAENKHRLYRDRTVVEALQDFLERAARQAPAGS